MNPVLIPTRNNLELTKQCVESVLAQDIPTKIFVFDNGSTDGTEEYLVDLPNVDSIRWESNAGVSYGWNWALRVIFGQWKREHVLVLNNDTIIPPWFYRDLLSYEIPFVTGVAVNDMAAIEQPAQRMPLTPNPDFSAFLISRTAWQTIGLFNEEMVNYCSDCDYHVRGHRLGVPMMKANVPYYHVGSATMRLGSQKDQDAISNQATIDRLVFHEIYGCLPGEPAYNDLFKD